MLILLGFERILNDLYVIFRHKKRALVGSVIRFYRSWRRMILSDLWVMGERKRLRKCSLIFMGKLRFEGCM